MLPGTKADRQRGQPRLPDRHARLEPRPGRRLARLPRHRARPVAERQDHRRDQDVRRRAGRRTSTKLAELAEDPDLQARGPGQRRRRPARGGAVATRSRARRSCSATSTWSTSPPTSRARSRPSPFLKPGLKKIDPALTAKVGQAVRQRQRALLDGYRDPSAAGRLQAVHRELRAADAAKLSQDASQALQDPLSQIAQKVATAQ